MQSEWLNNLSIGSAEPSRQIHPFASNHPLRYHRRASADRPTQAAMTVSLALICLACIPANAQSTQAPAAPIIQPGPPGAPSKQLPSSTTGHVPSLSPADVDFMQGMIMHHSQAVEMTALIPTHTQNQAVRTLGSRISRSQSDEMNFMKRWLALRGQPISMSMPGMPDMDMKGNAMPAMPGMLTPAQMAALRQARGTEFDRLFLSGMIQHHNGALIMVKQLFDTAGAGQDADIFDFATDADNTQRAEIKIMQDLLKNIPLSNSPKEKE
jgi:uncharacterized protein (DUF305 family)